MKLIFFLVSIVQIPSTLIADSAAQAPGPSFLEIMILPLGFLFIMFLMIRPQVKKAKEQQNLISSLKVGDEVITTGGIIGKIKSIADSFVSLEVANNTAIKVIKQNILSTTSVLQKTEKK